MSYTKTDWVNGTTPVNATNMNKIEQELYDLDERGGTPAAYIKTVEKSSDGNTITFTKQDNTTVSFEGSFQPFPSDFVTNSTTYAFAESVLNHSSYKSGKSWYGELTCNDLPTDLVNVECKVTAMTNSIAVIELFSSNRSPYHWEYNTDSYGRTGHSGWKLIPDVRNEELQSLATGSYLMEVQKSGYDIFFKPISKYTAGSGITINANNQISTTGEGKIWRELVLDTEDLTVINSGGQIVSSLTTAYDPTNFKSDYILTKIDNTGSTEGAVLYSEDAMTKLYIDTYENAAATAIPIMAKELDYAMANMGFDYHYYKTCVLYAGADTGEVVFEGTLDDDNVVYVQDVSQQSWEQNYDVEGDKKPVAESREGLTHDYYGLAYVFHFKGNTTIAGNNVAFLVAMQDSQTSYWDSTLSMTRWANIQAGKIYPVTFDPASGEGSHGTERWMVDVVEDTREGHEGEMIAVEISAAQQATLYNDGISFTSGKYSVETFFDPSMKLKTPCVGNGDKTLMSVFSWNEPFTEEPTTHLLEFVGRPTGILNVAFYYDDPDEGYTTEKDGIYAWDIKCLSYDLTLIVPKSNLNVCVIQSSSEDGVSANTEYMDIVRHTMTISTNDIAEVPDGEYACNFSFCAVNNQYGDSSWEYVLHSDESYIYDANQADWILPVSGFIGQVQSGAVATWYPAIRVIAGYRNESTDPEVENWMRTLYVTYFNNGQLIKVPLLSDTNSGNYTIRNFRSVIGTVLGIGKYKK